MLEPSLSDILRFFEVYGPKKISKEIIVFVNTMNDSSVKKLDMVLENKVFQKCANFLTEKKNRKNFHYS